MKASESEATRRAANEANECFRQFFRGTKLVEGGVDVAILTNSLAATDVAQCTVAMRDIAHS